MSELQNSYYTRRFVDRELGEKMSEVWAIVGSRDYYNTEELFTVMDKAIQEHGKPRRIISGGATGTDTLALHFAADRNIPFQEFPADWNAYGRKAGPTRNRKIVKESDRLFAFSSGNELTPGTKNVVTHARNQGRWVWVNVP